MRSGRGRASRGGRGAGETGANGNGEDDYELRSALAISDEIEQREAELRKQQEMLEKAQLEQALALSMADSAARQIEEEKARNSGREKARTRQRQIEVREQQQRAREREQEWVREKATLRAEAAARKREAAQMKREREDLGTAISYSTSQHISERLPTCCGPTTVLTYGHVLFVDSGGIRSKAGRAGVCNGACPRGAATSNGVRSSEPRRARGCQVARV